METEIHPSRAVIMKITRTVIAALLVLVAAAACDTLPTAPDSDMTPVIGSGLGGGR